MKKIKFQQKPDTELYKYLTTYCLEVPQNEKGELIRGEAVKSLNAYQEMLANEEDRRVKVIFHKTGDPTQGHYVFVGLNGRGYQIPFDKDVVLPSSVVRVCDDAVVARFEQSGGIDKGRVAQHVTYQKLYPYTILEYMDEEIMMTAEERDINQRLESANVEKKNKSE